MYLPLLMLRHSRFTNWSFHSHLYFQVDKRIYHKYHYRTCTYSITCLFSGGNVNSDSVTYLPLPESILIFSFRHLVKMHFVVYPIWNRISPRTDWRWIIVSCENSECGMYHPIRTYHAGNQPLSRNPLVFGSWIFFGDEILANGDLLVPKVVNLGSRVGPSMICSDSPLDTMSIRILKHAELF